MKRFLSHSTTLYSFKIYQKYANFYYILTLVVIFNTTAHTENPSVKRQETMHTFVQHAKDNNSNIFMLLQYMWSHLIINYFYLGTFNFVLTLS